MSFFKEHIKRCIPDKLFLQLLYKHYFNKKLDLKNPQTFNEKLNWLKLYNRNPLYTKMVDKYEAKQYVSQIIGDKYIIPTFGVWNKIEEIDFDNLPNQFVLKTTHDSGTVIICKDKASFNKDSAKKKLNERLHYNYYYMHREWPYKNVKHRIIAEKFISSNNENNSITDYKFMCFNGKVKCIFVCTGRNSEDGLRINIYDEKWESLPFTRHNQKAEKEIEKPIDLDTMIGISEKLSKDIPFVRVDLYNLDGCIFFSELTFFPSAGFGEFHPEKWDKILGDWIKLP